MKIFKCYLISVLVIALTLTMFPLTAFSEDGEPPEGGEPAKAKRTILLYDCGSDLETEAGLASFNLEQILRANFSEDDDVRVIVMTGGADKWHLEKEKLVFPDDVEVPEDAICDPRNPESYEADEKKSQISNTYNQIWEAKGADAPENAGKMVLVDGDGVLGDGQDAKRSIIDAGGYVEEDGYKSFDYDKEDNYEWMCDPKVLKAFIDFGVENYPADKYDLILWDHGAGPDGGFCSDLHEPSHGWDMMSLDKIIDAVSDNKVVDPDEDGTADSKFDFIDFDACLMNSAEINLLLSDYADYYIASPENEPGYGQDYEGWLNEVGSDPEIDTYELGKKIVDDFIGFYTTEGSPGYQQDGTLAVVDLQKLTDGSRDFIGALDGINAQMQNEIVREQQYYDEFRSFKESIRYGELHYYDLGNLISQLSFVYDEADYENLHNGGFDDSNAYTTSASELMGILNDPEVIYARGTPGIRTKEHFYRDSDGSITSGVQGTSGMHLSFEPLDVPQSYGSHYMYMKMVTDRMDEKDPDEKDPRAQLMENIFQTMLQYGLVYRSGRAVTEMVSDGAEKSTIDYNAVKEYWQTNVDQYGDELWGTYVKPILDVYDGGEAEAQEWLEPVIRQQRDEAVLRDKISAKAVKTAEGTGCELTINDIKKQAIDCVTLNQIAELPAVEAFLNDPEHESYLDGWEKAPKEMTIGTIAGTEVIGFDLNEQGYEKAIDWLFEEKSEWKLDPPGKKWYALNANGSTFIASPEIQESLIGVPAGYFTTEMQKTYNMDGEEIMEPVEVCNVVYLVFDKDADGNAGKLTELYFQNETGGGRSIRPDAFVGDLQLYPLLEVSDGWGSCYLPASTRTFTLSADTVRSIGLNFIDVNDIPDIADTDGDGRKLHSTITINNIYGQKMDITDIVNKAGGDYDPGTKPAVKTKKANTLKVKGKTAKIKYRKLKKKTQKLKVSKVIKFVKKGQGKKTYKLVSVKKGKKSFKKYFKINKKSGKVTIKKNRKMKKGTYKVKVKVTAAGNSAYNAVTKKVTFKVRVK